jgi:hypothetical protein
MADYSDLTEEQIAAFPYFDLARFTYLGDKHWYTLTACGDSCPGEGYHGAVVPHLRDDNRWCAGSIAFTGHTVDGHATWDVECWEPLTLSPSLLCKYSTDQGKTFCGDHGYIREGKWVKA